MPKPPFRFFIIPLGAVATLATLSSQNLGPRSPELGSTQIRSQVVDCSTKSPTEVCVLSFEGDVR
ncbi:hypothetical protein NP284_15735 [Rhodopseudomonas pseudopalustris]|mgnify:CR=1 FL=1|uniref:Uncharacterized protein n=1 Tax=Rhodopseudomonas faecalis TaxID=99655 RepID=A0A318TP83_9BRAD|nr:hypothetical protein [Rhodopseudomonas faecalis]PYF01399.1 hypothetical protein BJ122_12244 [Rhodopseudomonas faecalis]TAH67568.1 MAG: hypothetical protein EWM45_07405 [Rhodopseudomonas palustris]